MRKLFFLVLTVVVTVNTFAQSDLVVGTKSGKVKTEKKSTWGIALEMGNASYSLDGFDCDPGYGGELKAIYTGPLNPRNQESRWYAEASLGYSFYSGSAINKEARKKYRDSSSDDIFFVEMFNVNMRFKCILNRYSNSGKWFLYPGFNFCPLVVGIPIAEGEGYKRHLGSGETGITFGLNAGAGYQTKHWCVTAGGYAKVMAPYSDDSDAPAISGLTVSLAYLF